MQKKGAALRGLQEEGLAGGSGSGPGLCRAGEASPVRLDFAPVPRKYRHDGWTPERQKAFIEALADTGCVSRAARMVNISQQNAYALRRSPGAEEFRKAWDAALDFGLKRLKDIAFERAIEGYLVPVFVGGKLIGFRRKHNDALLMFCLRHYGQDESGRRVTVNYFSTRASAGASAGAAPVGDGGTGGGGAAAGAEASATTVRTVISGPADGAGGGDADAAAAVLNGFEGVALDPQAAADIQAALEACAARARDMRDALEAGGAAGVEAELDNPQSRFVRLDDPDRGPLEPVVSMEPEPPFVPGEDDWRQAGAEMPAELAYWRDRAAAAADPSAQDLHGRRTRGATGSGMKDADEGPEE